MASGSGNLRAKVEAARYPECFFLTCSTVELSSTALHASSFCLLPANNACFLLLSTDGVSLNIQVRTKLLGKQQVKLIAETKTAIRTVSSGKRSKGMKERRSKKRRRDDESGDKHTWVEPSVRAAAVLSQLRGDNGEETDSTATLQANLETLDAAGDAARLLAACAFERHTAPRPYPSLAIDPETGLPAIFSGLLRVAHLEASRPLDGESQLVIGTVREQAAVSDALDLADRLDARLASEKAVSRGTSPGNSLPPVYDHDTAEGWEIEALSLEESPAAYQDEPSVAGDTNNPDWRSEDDFPVSATGDNPGVPGDDSEDEDGESLPEDHVRDEDDSVTDHQSDGGAIQVPSSAPVFYLPSRPVAAAENRGRRLSRVRRLRTRDPAKARRPAPSIVAAKPVLYRVRQVLTSLTSLADGPILTPMLLRTNAQADAPSLLEWYTTRWVGARDQVVGLAGREGVAANGGRSHVLPDVVVDNEGEEVTDPFATPDPTGDEVGALSVPDDPDADFGPDLGGDDSSSADARRYASFAHALGNPNRTSVERLAGHVARFLETHPEAPGSLSALSASSPTAAEIPLQRLFMSLLVMAFDHNTDPLQTDTQVVLSQRLRLDDLDVSLSAVVRDAEADD